MDLDWGDTMLIDYHIHALSHGEYQPDAEWYREYLLRAAACGINEIGFSEHDEYWEQVKPESIRRLAEQVPAVKIKVGLETEFRHAQDTQIQQFLKRGSLDYVIGSVHFLGEWNFDHPDYKERFDWYPIDEIYQQYFAELLAMIISHQFDIVGHLDLIKIWGRRPDKSISSYLEPLLGNLRRSGMAIEINSGGLRKPVQEIYPEPALLSMLYAANIPLTLGSDAHHPDQVGWELDRCYQLARQAGYRKLAGFTGRRMQLITI
ncbi:MAG: histidinol-phosphatase HisJ family protein [Methylocystaceae bacterium]